MATLGIFTVKSIHRHEGRHYTYGGFGRYLGTIRTRFDHTVLVAHVRDAPPRPGDYEIPPGRLDIIALPPLRNELEALFTLPVQLWRCWQAVPRFDVAHARMPDYTGVIGALVCRLRGKPVFCQIIDDWALLARKTPWTKKYGLGIGLKLHLWLYDWCERLVCRGQLVFAQGSTCHEKHRGTADSTLVFSSSHALEDIRVPRPRFLNGPPLILNVARLNAVKNQKLLIDTLAWLRRQGETWRLRLVGQGPHRASLKEQARRLGVDDVVEFTGEIAHGDSLWRHFDEADVFALSSLSEGTPKVVLEAMARGLPVVATAVSGVPDMVPDGERGLLVHQPDVASMAAALRRMRDDERLRSACVARASTFARENTVERQIDQMLAKVFARWPQLGESKKGDHVA